MEVARSAFALAGVALGLALLAVALGCAALMRTNQRGVAELRVPTSATRRSKPFVNEHDVRVRVDEGL